jgi:hypothetical protein
MSGTGSLDCPVRCWEDDIHRLGRILLIVYLLETGLVLLVAPWSTFWERNLLVETVPLLGGVMRLAVVRGAVSGVGVVNLCAGLWELAVSLITIARPAVVGVPRSSERAVRGEGPVLHRDL